MGGRGRHTRGAQEGGTHPIRSINDGPLGGRVQVRGPPSENLRVSEVAGATQPASCSATWRRRKASRRPRVSAARRRSHGKIGGGVCSRWPRKMRSQPPLSTMRRIYCTRGKDQIRRWGCYSMGRHLQKAGSRSDKADVEASPSASAVPVEASTPASPLPHSPLQISDDQNIG